MEVNTSPDVRIAIDDVQPDQDAEIIPCRQGVQLSLNPSPAPEAERVLSGEVTAFPNPSYSANAYNTSAKKRLSFTNLLKAEAKAEAKAGDLCRPSGFQGAFGGHDADISGIEVIPISKGSSEWNMMQHNVDAVNGDLYVTSTPRQGCSAERRYVSTPNLSSPIFSDAYDIHLPPGLKRTGLKYHELRHRDKIDYFPKKLKKGMKKKKDKKSPESTP